MAYQLVQTPDGKWFAIDVDTAGRAFGPFAHRGAAVDAMTARSAEEERQERAKAAAARAEALSDAALAEALGAEIANPSPPPRGRPVPDNPIEADIAFEYYWRVRQGTKPADAVVTVVAEFSTPDHKISADHVRKVRAEYSAVGAYDDHLLEQLRAQAFQRRHTTPRQPTPPQRKGASAEDFLRATLADGPLLAQEVFRRGTAAGFSRRTLERAKSALGVVSPRGGRLSTWRLPDR